MRQQINIEVLVDVNAVAQRAATVIGELACAAVSTHGRFVVALSGGTTPWLMLRALGSKQLPWQHVHVAQTDERVAPAGHRERNLTQLQEELLGRTPLRPEQIHAMPVDSPDLNAAVAAYAATLRELAGSPPVFDLVHLGLGTDGHTASLVPGDPVLELSDQDVGLSGRHQGWYRMTLTLPAINRARSVLWVVTGKQKAAILLRLLDGDQSIPAGRVRRENAVVLADCAAARLIAADAGRQ